MDIMAAVRRLWIIARSACNGFGLAIIVGLWIGSEISVIEAATGIEIREAHTQLKRLKLIADTTRSLTQVIFEQPDLTITFESGHLAHFETIRVDSTDYRVGLYFEGKGVIRFSPPVEIEKRQLMQFYNSSELVQPFQRMVIMATQEELLSLWNQGNPSSHRVKRKEEKIANKMLERFSEDEAFYYMFELLRNLLEPAEESFVLLHAGARRKPRMFYMYDPYREESVGLWKHHSRPGESFMELVCSYRAPSVSPQADPGPLGITQLHAQHFDIDASISSQGAFEACANVRLTMDPGASQFGMFHLHSDLQVSEITDSAGREVAFLGHKKKKDNRPGLYVFFDRVLSPGERLQLKFCYKGLIAQERLGFFYITAGAQWYPSSPFRRRATFDLHFRTPIDYQFVATGDLVASRGRHDTMFTHWRVEAPTKNISFSIGPMKKFTFQTETGTPVDIFYSEELHATLGKQYFRKGITTGKHMEQHVAHDVQGALEYFSRQFGPYPYARLSVSEIMAYHGEAFAGFLHMGFPTWIQTDLHGIQAVFRAHEVAHQWWGVDVGYETYRDQWLSEAFAEYSGLLYVGHAEGNRLMLDLLKDYRKDIFSVRKYLFGHGKAASTIYLGYRASSTETEGDFGLVVYKKGAFVLHMLRHLMIDYDTMNEDRFFGMLREFYATYRGEDATTKHFKALAERYADMNLDWFFDQWVYGSQLPEYEFSYSTGKGLEGDYNIQCQVLSKGVGPDFKMYVPVSIEFEGGQVVYRRILIDAPAVLRVITDVPERPIRVRLNPFESVLAKVKNP
jgi:hypothetical protein